jgi:quinol monooxygenase YgiN
MPGRLSLGKRDGKMAFTHFEASTTTLGERTMICVIATLEVGVGERDKLLALLQTLVPKVRAEKGNLEYAVMIDTPSGLSAQGPTCDNVVTIVEKWESLDALKAHLKTVHMVEYFRAADELDLTMQLQVLEPV